MALATKMSQDSRTLRDAPFQFTERRHGRATRNPMYIFDVLRAVPLFFAIAYAASPLLTRQHHVSPSGIIIAIAAMGSLILLWRGYDLYMDCRHRMPENTLGVRCSDIGNILSGRYSEALYILRHYHGYRVGTNCFGTWISDSQETLLTLTFALTLVWQFLLNGFSHAFVYINIGVLCLVFMKWFLSRSRYIITEKTVVIQQMATFFVVRAMSVSLEGVSLVANFEGGNLTIKKGSQDIAFIPLREIANCHKFVGAMLAASVRNVERHD